MIVRKRLNQQKNAGELELSRIFLSSLLHRSIATFNLRPASGIVNTSPIRFNPHSASG